MTARTSPALAGLLNPKVGDPGTLSAETHRIGTGGLFVAASGLHAAPGVLPAGPGYMGGARLASPTSLLVDPARWVVPGTQTAQQGDYLIVNDAQAALPVSPQDPTRSRLGLAVAYVTDSQYTTGADDRVHLEVVPGALATTNPAVPATPDNALVLGTVTIPAVGGTVTFTPTTIPVTVTVGGIRPLTTTGVPAFSGAYDRQVVLDAGLVLWLWDATNTRWTPHGGLRALTTTGAPAWNGTYQGQTVIDASAVLWSWDPTAGTTGRWGAAGGIRVLTTAGAPGTNGAYPGQVVIDSAGMLWAWDATAAKWNKAGGGGGGGTQVVYDVQTYTAAGAFTWTRPVGALRTTVTLAGGGGGGGGGGFGGSYTPAGAGGTGGGCLQTTVDAATLGTTVTGALGVGGTGAAGSTGAAASSGTNGGATTFGGFTAAGGAGGAPVPAPVPAGAGAGGGGGGSTVAAGPTFAGNGATAGTAGGGGGGGSNVNTYPGGAGGQAPGTTSSAAGGPAAPSNTAGASAATTLPTGLFIGGGGAGGGAGGNGSGAERGGAGGNGYRGGGGGGGGSTFSGYTATTGGAGGNGGNGVAVVVTECLQSVPDPTVTPPAPYPNTTWDLQTYSTAGAFTWTRPTGATEVYLTLVGGGGGGGGGNGYGYPGAGGGGGAREEYLFRAADLTPTVAVAVGAGGAGGAAAASAVAGFGGAGAVSSFGSLIASGGGGGNGATAGAAGTFPAGAATGTYTGGTGGAGNGFGGTRGTGGAPGGGSGGQGGSQGGVGQPPLGYSLALTVAGGVAGVTTATAVAAVAVPGGVLGTGGAGGGSSSSGAMTGGPGGAGIYGSGGGGGGSSISSVVLGGNGGKGGDGLVVVRTLCVTAVGAAPGGVPALPASDKGTPGGVATLDPNGQVPASQLGNVPQPLVARLTTAQSVTATSLTDVTGMQLDGLTVGLWLVELTCSVYSGGSALNGNLTAANGLVLAASALSGATATASGQPTGTYYNGSAMGVVMPAVATSGTGNWTLIAPASGVMAPATLRCPMRVTTGGSLKLRAFTVATAGAIDAGATLTATRIGS